ncbi:Thioredoxin reductase [Pseudonocardia sp. Ae168_Ps1]|uniref:class I SAM-dependent methyltransferase n=1 Tax=unclassified Pseudonocardia TaxID=2619320 RepID=UPI00094B6E46|nr:MULTISPECIES: class I SAM-dependent methyltransferase [unclassified Pseudonocardia]OLL72586.1 Thioredoxin reductase [Pseudonocardia sp. Ae150A_Ps1]OLL78558.1 Thioredoxin reductase [Pseudonocardia sp. Ae168_Ps1]OLL87316.1 Thioredoxin reductase [Pseudonocardia sp. Ae263_Ps1]OLL92654.1 Thioredoxin reductase [Pseudonocardia sp. Ae356_Ps1]OLM19136.1 Thioredoxin reductase [Pseudonocardia sp. Ae707_Ps1]
MAVDDQERWDARHRAAGVGTPQPPDALRPHTGLLPATGRALDVACGRGIVAAWLAAQGLDVVAVDVSPAGLAAGAALVAAEQPPGRVRWVQADLDHGFPADDDVYDVVVCQRFRAPALYPALAAAVAPGGLLVVTVLSEVGDTGGQYRAAPGELPAAFGELEVVAHHEGGGEAHLVARRPA